MSGTRWSTVLAAIVKDGGPVTPHPDAETQRRLAENPPRLPPVTAYNVTRLEPALDTGEPPAPPIPARPYSPPPATRPPFRRRLWAVLTRRTAA